MTHKLWVMFVHFNLEMAINDHHKPFTNLIINTSKYTITQR